MPNLLGPPRRAITAVRGWFSGPHQRRNIAIAISAVAIVGAGTGIGVALSGSSAPLALPPHHGPGTTTTTAASAAKKTGHCPLTDAPPEVGDTVPNRPALLVKVGNEPDGARPQSGLNEADIVVDTPAEGFIMRYVAVFQCNNAAAIGPDRSVRWVDWNMVARQFGSPILAFAGGIDPNVNGVAGTPWIHGANLLEGGQSAGTRISSRIPPDNLYTSTKGLYALFPDDTTRPSPIFDYSAALPPGARPAKSIEINFSEGTDVIWKWDPTTHVWLHTYLGEPDIDVLSNQQVSTSNIVVEVVNYSIGPYCESGCPGGSGDVESQLVGSGSGWVLRQGTEVPVTWHRASQLSMSTFTNAAGQPVDLIPGRTWVEIVPNVQASGISITP